MKIYHLTCFLWAKNLGVAELGSLAQGRFSGGWNFSRRKARLASTAARVPDKWALVAGSWPRCLSIELLELAAASSRECARGSKAEATPRVPCPEVTSLRVSLLNDHTRRP